MVARTMLVTGNGAALVLRITNTETYVEQQIALMNPENTFAGSLVLSLHAVGTLLKRCDADVTITRRAGMVSLEVIGEALPLEVYSFEPDTYHAPVFPAPTVVVHRDRLRQILTAFATVVPLSRDPKERRIYSVGTALYISYLWSIMRAEIDLAGINLGVTDVAVILSLLANNGEGSEIQISHQGADDASPSTLAKIEAPQFCFCFPTTTTAVQDILVMAMSSIVDERYISVDYRKLCTAVYIAAAYPTSTGHLLMAFSDEGHLTVTIPFRHHRKPVVFTLERNVESIVTPSAEPVRVDAAMLRQILRSFSSEELINISLVGGDGGGIGIQAESHMAVLYSA